MRKLFDNCKAKRINICNFDTSKVENMDSMFFNCKLDIIQGLQELDTSNAIDMSFMFCNFEYNNKLDLRNFNTSNVRFAIEMFKNCKAKILR